MMDENNQCTLITVTAEQNGFKIKATQQYSPRFDWGHYHYAVENADGHIVDFGYSSGGVPRGKLNEVWCLEWLTRSKKYGRFIEGHDI